MELLNPFEPINPIDNDEMRQILDDAEVIAIVGLSSKEHRASNEVARYLQETGYKIIPVNPGEETILGEKAYPSLGDIPEPIDIVDVFRRSDAVPEIAREAVETSANVLWLQEGVINEDAVQMVKKTGMKAIQNICIMKIHQILF